MMFDIIGTSRNYISAGRLNVVAVTSPGRNISLPNVPSIQEAGIAGYDVQGWYALYASPGRPADRLARYRDATRKALASEDLKQKPVEQGYDLWHGTAQDVSERVRNEMTLWANVPKGMKFESRLSSLADFTICSTSSSPPERTASSSTRRKVMWAIDSSRRCRTCWKRKCGKPTWYPTTA